MADKPRWYHQGRGSGGWHAPRLMWVWIVAPLAVLGAGGAGLLIYHFVLNPLDINTAETLKGTLAILTLSGAVLAGVYAYRKQRIAESDAHRADAIQFADRYTTAAEQLGHDKAAVRLAGVYALARLADDWEEQRQVCIDVLCAYLRMPYQPALEATSTTLGEAPSSTPATYKEGERQVRHTIIRVIRDHLDPIQRHPPPSWSACDFDFTHVTFDGGVLRGSHFDGSADFSGAKFSGGTVDFTNAKFSGIVSFNDAKFNGAIVTFQRAEFSRGCTVDFTGAEFSGGKVEFFGTHFNGMATDFDGAKFSGGTVDFTIAEFSGGPVDFNKAEFSRDCTVDFNSARFSGRVHFTDARFSNSCRVGFRFVKFSGGTVVFTRAEFSGGTVAFDNAEFSGSTVAFDDMEFSGSTVTFNDAKFSDGMVGFLDTEFSDGMVGFNDAKFSGGTVGFTWAKFSGGTVTFKHADFCGGTVFFTGAEFSGSTVLFTWAKFSGGTVHFDDVTGAPEDWGPFQPSTAREGDGSDR